MKKRVVFTGGGSGGHVIPAVTLIKELQRLGNVDIGYIGGRNGVEREIIPPLGVEYSGISTGKLRRYISLENFIDFFKVFVGFLEAFFILLNYSLKSRVLIFSTGGFVCVPVVFAAKCLGLRVYIHEQTSRVGLANKLSSYVADKIFYSFEESKKYFPPKKSFFSGYPLRSEIQIEVAPLLELEHLDFTKVNKPLLFITGGGNGSLLINELVDRNLVELKSNYCIVHQVGKNFEKEFKKYNDENYLALGFIGDEMIGLMRRADIILSRAGAGTVCELIALNKKSLFIPLKIAQKNEQYWNAMEAVKKLNSVIIEEDDVQSLNLKEVLENFLLEKSKPTTVLSLKSGTEYLIREISNNS